MKDSKSLILQKYSGDLQLALKVCPAPEKNEVQVKMMCATIHPSDIQFIKGFYGYPRPEILPITPGFEGSGEIVAVGPNVDKSLISKRVCLGPEMNKKSNETFNGIWTQYFNSKLRNVLIFPDNIPYETICFAMLNPMTAMGFLYTVKKHNSSAVIQNGGSSAFAKMFARLCKKEGIEVINLVRNPSQIETLNKEGSKYVISTSEKTWQKDLWKLANKLNAKVCFDCVGGEMTGRLLFALPDESIMYHFGNLELKRISGIDSSELLFKKKELRGWWMPNWLREAGVEHLIKCRAFIVEEFKKSDNVFKTNFSKEFSLEDFDKALDYYSKNMSEGKVIMRPNF